jgi:hypothetical protein
MRRFLIVGAAVLVSVAVAVAQTKPTAQKPGASSTAKPGTAQPATAKPAGSKPVVATPKTMTVVAETTCPSVLGTGVTTGLRFCDVTISRNPADGIIVRVPPHKGLATLSFDLHNRHTYSAEQVKAGRGYAAYTATMGVLTMDGTLLARGVVRGEFRTSRDLVDRVGGGAGVGGVKAVAPTGTEPIAIDVPEEVTEVSLLGEKLSVVRYEGPESFSAAGRPIAVVSNIQVEYVPVPAKPATKKPASPVKKKSGTD